MLAMLAQRGTFSSQNLAVRQARGCKSSSCSPPLPVNGANSIAKWILLWPQILAGDGMRDPGIASVCDHELNAF